MFESFSLANAASDPRYDEPPYITAFQKISGIRALFFSARGGVSDGAYKTASGHLGLNCALGGNDDTASKNQNRQLVADMYRTNAHHLLTSTYGDRYTGGDLKIENVTKPWTADKRPVADALITSQPGLVLGLLTADCAPILLAAPDMHIIAAVHLGWYGALNGILERTIDAMIKRGAEPEKIMASIGPCAGVKDTYDITPGHATMCMTMDERVAEYLVEKDGKIFLRLQNYAERQLRDKGIGNTISARIDTIVSKEHYSRRGGSAPSSLMFSGIMLDGPR